MKQKGLILQPVLLVGRQIADSFWGKGWCVHLESFNDYVHHLPGGRSYLRNGSVCHLEIKQGKIEALVSGSSLYSVTITVDKLSQKKLNAIKSVSRGRIRSLVDLLQGKFDYAVTLVVKDRKNGIFPLPGDMSIECNCPERAGMCKHLAAVLYGVGARLDYSPEMLFLLRGLNHEELFAVPAVQTPELGLSTEDSMIDEADLDEIFVVEETETAEIEIPKQPVSAEKTVDIKRTTCISSFPVPLTGDVIFSWRTAVGDSEEAFALRLNVFPMSVRSWEKTGADPLNIQSRTLIKLRRAWEQTDMYRRS